MKDPVAVLEGFPDAVLVLEGGTVQWTNLRAHQLLQRKVLVGCALSALLAEGEFDRLELLRSQRSAGWALPDTCRVRFVTDAPNGSVLVDVRIGGDDQISIITARDATDATRAELLMGRLAETSSGVLMRDVNALFDAAEQIFIDLKWVVAFTQMLPGGRSRVERVIALPDDPVGNYGRSLLGREQGMEATPVLQRLVATQRPMFLDNLPTKIQPGLPAVKLSASMSASRVARSAWCPIFTPGLTHVLAVTGRDLTEHDFAAIQLFAAQVGATIRLTELRLELVKRERLAAIGQTATVLSHELRTPLAVIFNATSSLKQLEAPGTQHAVLVAMLEEEAGNLQRLVTDLLDFGGLAPPRLERIEIVNVVSVALDMVQHDPIWRQKHPRLEFDATVRNTEALGDSSQLQRAVHNLVLNAAQHCVTGGQIRISVEGKPEEVEVRVWNDGPQIQPEVASRLFEPFFTTRPNGTGLGLAITQRICVDHGGTVKLETVPTGASFVITLPRKPITPG